MLSSTEIYTFHSTELGPGYLFLFIGLSLVFGIVLNSFDGVIYKNVTPKILLQLANLPQPRDLSN